MNWLLGKNEYPVPSNNTNNINHALEIITGTTPVDGFTGEIGKTLLFFGHQYRFNESLIKKMNECGTNIEDYKFSNGAILNLIIVPTYNKNYELYLSLVYTGDAKANTTGKKYWVAYEKEASNQANIYYFQPQNITVTKYKFNEKFKNNSEFDKAISCYFVRHGKAKHNAVMVVNTETNTDLVNPNDDAIKEGGKTLYGILSRDTQSIDYIFVSDLIRTQQTASLFLQGYTDVKPTDVKPTDAKPTVTIPKEIYVLACLHELNSRNKGLDQPTKGPYYYFENQTTCNHNDNDKFYNSTGNPKTCKEITIKNETKKQNETKNLNWTDYEQNFTDDHRTSENQIECNDKHFLGIALDIITKTTEVNTGTRSLNGGKPKKRTTRKSSKSQKPTTQRKPRKSRKSKH